MPRVRLAALACLVFAAMLSSLRAQPRPDPFDDQFKAAAVKNQLPDKFPDVPPKAEPELTQATTAILPFIDFKATVLPVQAKRGEVVRFTIEGETKPWSYTYSAVSKHPKQLSGTQAKIRFKDAPWLTPLYPIAETGAEVYKDGSETQFILHNKFQWQQDVFIASDAPLGKHTVIVQPYVGVCTKKYTNPEFPAQCFPPTVYKPLRVVIDIVDSAPLPAPTDLDTRKKVPPLRDTIGRANPTGGTTDTTGFGDDLGALLFAAFVGAILMLLTPCVFPMIPITVNFFIKQSEKEHHRPFIMASVYAGTIVLLLTCVILLVGGNIIKLANDAWFNMGLGMVLILFALGLFGMFDVGLNMFFGTVMLLGVGYGLARVAKLLVPSLATGNHEFALVVGSLLLAIPVTWGFVQAIRRIESLLGFEESAALSFLARQESRGGMLGAAFMAMTFTITSFSCTGPFLGILLAPLAGTNISHVKLLLAALVYAATFAAPFFLLAIFPTYLKKLPKSGGWMTTIKVTMGFLEIGAALKFLSNADLFWFPGNPRIFNYDTVLVSWIALSVACSLYLFGVFRLHHDTPEDHIGVPRMIFASLFLGMGLYLTPLLFGIVPRGLVMEGVVSFLPPDFERSGGMPNDPIPWIKHDYEAAWKQAIAEKKLIFIDFTGVNCVNCRENERNVLRRPSVVEAMKKYICVKLYTDTVPNTKLNPTQAEEEAAVNQGYQLGLIGVLTQPSYVILDPSPSQPFNGPKIDARVVDSREGRIYDAIDFERFLTEPQKGRTALGQNLWIGDDYAAAWKEAVAAKKQLFVFFYSNSDVNGRKDERNFLNTPDVQLELNRFVCVKLAVEKWTHQEMELALIESLTSPAYVVVQPGVQKPNEGEMPIGKAVRHRSGIFADRAEFIAFLRGDAMCDATRQPGPITSYQLIAVSC